MLSILLLHFCVAGSAPLAPVRWSELTLSIRRAPDVSSDTATVCRVRIENNGRTSWPGRRLAFEARAIREGLTLDRRRGCFGGTLGPHEALETVVAFVGVYDRFEISPIEKVNEGCGGSSRGARRGRGNKRKR